MTFDRTERLVYSHDIAAMPKMVKPFVGGTGPDAVVRPVSEEELVVLTRWFSNRGIPVVPRGKGSSGYGGAVPARNGPVVDFFRMRDVLEIDEERLNVTVEPGITRERPDRIIGRKGLSTGLYPGIHPQRPAAGSPGGRRVGSEHGRYVPGLHHLRTLRPEEFGLAPDRAFPDGSAGPPDRRGEEETFPPVRDLAAAVRSQGDIRVGYRKDRTGWLPEDLPEAHGPGKQSDTRTSRAAPRAMSRTTPASQP